MPPFVASRDRNLTQTSKSTEVIVRFGLRMAAITAFAVLSGIGFQRGLTVMLWMSAILATVIAMFDREELADTTLNHWDEADREIVRVAGALKAEAALLDGASADLEKVAPAAHD